MKSDITIDDLKAVQDTLDGYERTLAYAKRNWPLLTLQEKKKTIEAFEQLTELTKEFA